MCKWTQRISWLHAPTSLRPRCRLVFEGRDKFLVQVWLKSLPLSAPRTPTPPTEQAFSWPIKLMISWGFVGVRVYVFPKILVYASACVRACQGKWRVGVEFTSWLGIAVLIRTHGIQPRWSSALVAEACCVQAWTAAGPLAVNVGLLSGLCGCPPSLLFTSCL